MRIEAVSVCVDYSDFLEQTLPTWLPHVDDLVVVTSPRDGRTKRLCARHSVRCLPTDCFYRHGDRFNKAAGINYGLSNLRLEGWALHLDADIALPSRARWMLDGCELDPAKLYGCDRVNCVGRAAWDRLKADPPIPFEWRCLVSPPRSLPLGSRIAHMDYGGYCPIGFFQLWNPRGSGIDRYPVRQDSAEHTDVLHAIQWPRQRRELLGELVVIHLETRSKGRCGQGENWDGRQTPAFTTEEGPFPSSGRPAAAGSSGCAPPPWQQTYGG